MKSGFKVIPGYAKALIGLSLLGNFLFITAVNYGVKHPSTPVTEVKGATTETVTPQVSQKLEPAKVSKEVQETESIPYTSSSVNDPNYDSGKNYIKVQGSAGQKVKTYKVEYLDGKEVGRSLVSEVVSIPATNEVIATGTKVAAAPVAQAPASTYVAPSTNSSSAYYANCSAARAAGVAPLHRGDPGYRSALDRDNDGIACE